MIGCAKVFRTPNHKLSEPFHRILGLPINQQGDVWLRPAPTPEFAAVLPDVAQHASPPFACHPLEEGEWKRLEAFRRQSEPCKAFGPESEGYDSAFPEATTIVERNVRA